MIRRTPADRDYTRARAALPREQREVWGAKGDNIGVAGEVQPDGSQRVILNERGRELFGGNAEVVLVPPPRDDGTCADDSDECDRHLDCPGARVHEVEDCWRDAARDAKPLIAGGQGRSDEATMSAGEIVGWVVGLTFILAAVGVALHAWGVL